MSGSNIFLQLITATGPVLGEGLLDGWEGSIELRDFSWGMHAVRDTAKVGRFSGAALLSALGVGTPISVKMEPLKFTKRFDTASSQIHICLDNHLPVVSASITVLHIKHKGRVMHQPGFVLLATNGFFQEVELSLQDDGRQVELVETVKLNFKNIVVTYMKTMGPDNLPTAPFFFPKLSPI
jgi:type VI protein secretion system component Hcp